MDLLNKIYNCDNAELLAQLPDDSVDAIITDPPYELGFMDNVWDKSGIANDVGRWREHLRVLKPSGHLLAFSGSRTYHRMVCAIQDAGFEIRDQIQWLYGSGFNKSKSHLKPAHEPICVARKTGQMKPLNLDGGRIPVDWNIDPAKRKNGKKPSQTLNCYGTDTRTEVWHQNPDGRLPSNVILDETTAEILDEQTGTLSPGGGNRTHKQHHNSRSDEKVFGGGFAGSGFTTPNYNDIGGASRFFYVAKASPSERNGITHPTVKPIKLISQLVKIYSNEGDVIFDGFGGSGTTAICCLRERRNFILCEWNDDYFTQASARIEAEKVRIASMLNFDEKEI